MLTSKTSLTLSLDMYLKSALILAEYKALGLYTQALRSHVSSYGWPDQIVNQLEVSHDGEAPQIVFPKELEHEIQRLNYGTQDTPPSPALSTFTMGAN